jgi:hypothetical protein
MIKKDTNKYQVPYFSERITPVATSQGYAWDLGYTVTLSDYVDGALILMMHGLPAEAFDIISQRLAITLGADPLKVQKALEDVGMEVLKRYNDKAA